MHVDPRLVSVARERARAQGFDRSCLDEVGRLLALLASHIHDGKILEIGAGMGVGTAWLASAARVEVYTVDDNPERASHVASLFRDHPQVHVVTGDWTDALIHGPFRLIFADAKPAKTSGAEAVIAAAAPGGLIVLDDLSPEEYWPEAWKGKPDPIREFWLNHPLLFSTEILTSREHSTILACRAV